MKDQRNALTITLLHPKVRDEVTAVINEVEKSFPDELAIFINQGLRTIDYQNQLYTLGRTVKNPDGASAQKPLGNIVTKARGGSSFHNYGLAIDFCWSYLNKATGKFEYDNNKSWNVGPIHAKVVQAFKDKGWEWGGDWHSIKDLPHLEKRFGYAENCKDLYAKYLKKDFISGTQYVNL